MAHGRPADDSDTGYSFTFSPRPRCGITTDIVEAIAWVKGVDPLDLTPLGNVVDTDALDRLIEPDPAGDGTTESPVDRRVGEPLIVFHYEDCLIRIEGANGFSVHPEPSPS